METTTIFFIRHSEIFSKSSINVISNNCDKEVEVEKAFLSVTGEEKAKELSNYDELKNLDAVYSSNYVKALSTAKYIAKANNTVINIDDRLNERKIGKLEDIEWKEFSSKQAKDFSFKLEGGESLEETKKRMVESVKNILMFESGNRVAVVSHSTSLTTLFSAWCEVGRNYDDDIILTYKDETIIDGNWTAPMLFKVVFDGMNVVSIEYINYKK